MKSIDIVLGYDTDSLRSTVTTALLFEPRMTLVGAASSPELLLESINANQPDVVLLALSTQLGFGHSFIQLLVEHFPDCRIVILGPDSDSSIVDFLCSLGALGYVCQSSPPPILLKAIHSAIERHLFVDPAVKPPQTARRKSSSARSTSGGPHAKFLSHREIEVLELLAQGYTNMEVAQRLSLSIKSAETYRIRLMRKLGIRGRAELFRYALEHGLVGAGRIVSEIPQTLEFDDTPPSSKPKTDWSMDTGFYSQEPTHLKINSAKTQKPNSTAPDNASNIGDGKSQTGSSDHSE